MNEIKTPAAFACELMDQTLIRGRHLPPGFVGMTDIEVQFYNYCVSRPPLDRSLVMSQGLQDLWVCFFLDCWSPHSRFHRDGFFVEFGALDGVALSNTYLLEKQFGWRGVLVEPGPSQFPKIAHRRSCGSDRRCVWRESGETLDFNQVVGSEELASIDDFSGCDLHGSVREGRRSVVKVESVSLLDLLSDWNAPKVIDYLSVDTEGSEYEILRAFDFRIHQFRTLSVEHNMTEKREAIHSLLEDNGYRLVRRSSERFDDMYVMPELVPPHPGFDSRNLK